MVEVFCGSFLKWLYEIQHQLDAGDTVEVTRKKVISWMDLSGHRGACAASIHAGVVTNEKLMQVASLCIMYQKKRRSNGNSKS